MTASTFSTALQIAFGVAFGWWFATVDRRIARRIMKAWRSRGMVASHYPKYGAKDATSLAGLCGAKPTENLFAWCYSVKDVTCPRCLRALDRFRLKRCPDCGFDRFAFFEQCPGCGRNTLPLRVSLEDLECSKK